MDGFDSNPFDGANPFEDSSISRARRDGNDENKTQYDNYNPFAADQFAQQPAVIQPSETRSSTYVPIAPSPASAAVASLTEQQMELDRRAAELDKREQDLSVRASTLGSGGIANNFPPLPSFCPCKPCFVQDFNIDIPQPYQKIVKIHFYVWIAYCILMLLNIAGSLAYLIAHYGTDSGTTFGLSILYFVLFPPLSYVFWFRGIYKAFKNDSSLNYFLYFIVFFVHNCINIFWCIGIPSSGAVGFISGLATAGTNPGVGVFMIIIGILFGTIGAIGIVLILRVLHYYRHMDASFKKAQEELASGVLTSRTAHQAAATMASSAMSDQSQRNRF